MQIASTHDTQKTPRHQGVGVLKNKSYKRTEAPGKLRRKTKGWNEARRVAQAARCRALAPWLKSTGPRSVAGKARAAQNATKTGARSREVQAIRDYLRWQRGVIRRFNASMSFARSRPRFHSRYKRILKP